MVVRYAVLAIVLSSGIANAAPQCEVGSMNAWSSGFVARDITLTNDSAEALSPPRIRLTFDSPIEVTDLWGADATGLDNVVTLEGIDYNATVAPGRTMRFVIKGTGNPTSATCEVITGNGSAPDVPSDAPNTVRPDNPTAPTAPAEPDAPAPAPEPDTSEPGAPVTEVPEPDVSEPEAPVTEAADPDVSEPEAPVTEAPEPDAPEFEVPASGSGEVVVNYTLDDMPSGPHDDDSWTDLWAPATWANGPDEGRVFIDDEITPGSSGKSVRVTYPANSRTSSDSGAQWHMGLGGVQADDLYLAYWVRFDDDFDYVLGGKLPGFRGSLSYEDRSQEWSGRLMWREEGKVEFYTHIADSRERWWWNTEGVQARFVPGQWHHVEMHFTMNTPGQQDGVMEGWLDGVKAASYDDVMFRAAGEPGSALNKVFFSTFFGGSSGDRWNAVKDEFAWFDNFTVARERIGYPGPASQ